MHGSDMLKRSRVKSSLIYKMQCDGGGREVKEGAERGMEGIYREGKRKEEGLRKTTEQSEPWRWMGRENMNERRERVFF